MLARKVLSILLEPATAAELRAANWQRAAQQYSLERMVQAYAELFEELSKPSSTRG